MPIIHNTGSTTLTGDAISFFRICQMRAAVGLELNGLHFRRSVTAQAKREFKIKGNRQAVYDWLTAKVEEMKVQQEHVTVENGRTIREVGGTEVQ